MHNNYYFLRQLSITLDQQLKGFTIVSCFSQNKEELIIELNNGERSIFIKAHLLSSFSCLSFPSNFNRAKKNSVDLFGEIVLKKILSVTQYNNERSFAINLESGYSLIFKMHANRSNILLAKDGNVIQVFKNQLKADKNINLAELNRLIDFGEEYFKIHLDDLPAYYFTFGKVVWSYLDENGFNTLPYRDRWKLFKSTIKHLEDPEYYIIKRDNKIKLSLLPSGEVLKKYNTPIDCLNDFFHLHVSSDVLNKEKSALLKKLTITISACEGYIAKTQKKLDEITDDSPYKMWADVLMANLHQIDKGRKSVILKDFSDQPVKIKLNPELSIQKNAENYYRKGKNQEIEIRKLSESIAQKKNEIETANEHLQRLEKVTSLEEFKAEFKSQKEIATKKIVPLPFHRVAFKNFEILIGKNAVNNDLLTLKYAHKDDMWLHAKDVAGSHVVIKHQSGKVIPKDVIERAAELAAYNSKRKTETLCPVAYTLKKFVRKRKGDVAGVVVVEKEQVIMVEPKL